MHPPGSKAEARVVALPVTPVRTILPSGLPCRLAGDPAVLRRKVAEAARPAGAV